MAEYTDAEIERMARAGAAADLSKPFSMEADMQAARWALRYPDAYLPAFATAVLAERAKIDAERTPAPSVAEHHGAGMRCPAAAEPVFPRPPRDEAEREACDNFDGAWCFAEGEDAYCTRRDGHNGNHVGSDGDGAILAVWPATPAGPAPVVPSPLTERLAEALEIVDGAAELLDEQGLGHRLDRVRALLAEYDATPAAPTVTEAREPAPTPATPRREPTGPCDLCGHVSEVSRDVALLDPPREWRVCDDAIGCQGRAMLRIAALATVPPAPAVTEPCACCGDRPAALCDLCTWCDAILHGDARELPPVAAYFKEHGGPATTPGRGMTDVTHELKTWPKPFSAILDGSKTCEIRVDDREFKVGDTLRLREWAPEMDGAVLRGKYTGREVLRRVTHKTRGGDWGLPDDLCVMSIAPLGPTAVPLRADLAAIVDRLKSEAAVVPLGEVFHGGPLDGAPRHDVMLWAARYRGGIHGRRRHGAPVKPAGTMIRAAREAQGMSLRELARRVEVTPSTISILERMKGGCTNVSDGTLATVAAAVGLDADAVLAAAGRIAPDVRGILLHGGPDLWRALREAKRRGLTGGDLMRAATRGMEPK